MRNDVIGVELIARVYWQKDGAAFLRDSKTYWTDMPLKDFIEYYPDRARKLLAEVQDIEC